MSIFLHFLLFTLGLHATKDSDVDEACERGVDCLEPLGPAVQRSLARQVARDMDKSSDVPAPDPNGALAGNGRPRVSDHLHDEESDEEDTVSGMVDRPDDEAPDMTAVSQQEAKYGMTLGQCVKNLETTSANVKVYQANIEQMKKVVTSSQDKVKGAEGIAQELWNKETAFSGELQNLYVLYNDVAVRSNTLEKWMNDEKVVRDQLATVYRVLDQKSVRQSEELFGLTSTLRNALSKMQAIHDHVSQVLTSVANAETAMYEWAYNVTVKVNSQTTKIVNLAEGLEYRIQQVDAANKEVNKMAQVFLTFATKYKDADLIDAANDMITEYQVNSGELQAAGVSSLPQTANNAQGTPSGGQAPRLVSSTVV